MGIGDEQLGQARDALEQAQAHLRLYLDTAEDRHRDAARANLVSAMSIAGVVWRELAP